MAAMAFRTEIALFTIADVPIDVVNVNGSHCEPYLSAVAAERFASQVGKALLLPVPIVASG